MRGKLMLLGLMVAALSSVTHARALEVGEAVITTAVIEREPVDAVVAYPIQDGLLYCFTRVLGAVEPTVVVHSWFRGDELMSRSELPVRSPDWRTWSAKRLLADQEGDWRVEVRDAGGELLTTVNFELR